MKLARKALTAIKIVTWLIAAQISILGAVMLGKYSSGPILMNRNFGQKKELGKQDDENGLPTHHEIREQRH